MKTTHVAETKCPQCACAIDAHTHLSGDDATPTPGSLSVCLRCAAYLSFNDDLSIRPLTTAEFEALPLDVRLLLRKARRAAWEVVPVELQVGKRKL